MYNRGPIENLLLSNMAVALTDNRSYFQTFTLLLHFAKNPSLERKK